MGTGTINTTDNSNMLGTIIARLACEQAIANMPVTMRCYRDFDQEISENRTISVPIRTSPTIQTKTPGTAVSFQSLSTGVKSISIDTWFTYQFVVEDNFRGQTRTKFIDNTMQDVGVAMAEKIETTVMTAMWNAISGVSTGYVGTYGDAVTLSGLIAVGEKFDNAKALTSYPRNVIVSPKGKTDIFNLTSVNQAQAFGDPRVIQKGQLPPIVGLDLFMSQLTPTSGANYKGLCFVEPAFAVVSGRLDAPEAVNSYNYTDKETGLTFRITRWREEKESGTAWKLDVLFGAGALVPDWIFELRH